jgi:hypothetical protein
VLEQQHGVPGFVREREAWFKAGANALATIVVLASFGVAAVVGLLVAVFDLGGRDAAALTITGTWLSVLAGAGYLNIAARRTAKLGGVTVDRF